MARRGGASAASRRTPVPSGERDKWVLLEELTDVTGPDGFPGEDWSPLVEVYANKENLSGEERTVTNQLTAPYSTRWEICYRPDMDPDAVDVPKTRRVVYLGRTYDIVDASLIGRNAGVELLTLARQG